MRPDQVAFRVLRFDIDLNKVDGLSSELRQKKLNSLIKRYYTYSSTQIPTHIDQVHEIIVGFVDFLVEVVSPTVSTNTFKIYKKSVLPIIPYTDEYVKLNDTKGIDKRQLGKTASKKQKFLTHEQLERIINHNSKHRHKSSLAQVINVLLPSTVLTGLRPSEWFNAMIRQCAGRLTLIVRTDKLYKEAQARLGVDKDKDMTLFIPYRGIPLDHLDEHDVQRIRATIGIMNDINKSERNNREFLDELAKNLRTTVLDIWSREERPDIAIYSARHQFIANMKASKIEDATITYLAGQIYEETKHRHYASKLKGEVTTTPYNVEEIMQFVKTEINSRFQGDVS
ncbi:MAG TPA: hypothetical protein DG048_23820 [Pseudoalteromonas sp.]|jgi:integrase|nr:hypothetical protein [Pseudoalteromonas sp.]|tara:strand:- start:25138 stop:26157 length:1020 start_codon:yes stop_codon:yes gene_type:complete